MRDQVINLFILTSWLQIFIVYLTIMEVLRGAGGYEITTMVYDNTAIFTSCFIIDNLGMYRHCIGAWTFQHPLSHICNFSINYFFDLYTDTHHHHDLDYTSFRFRSCIQTCYFDVQVIRSIDGLVW